MRTQTLYSIALAGVAACASASTIGPLGEGSSSTPSIVSIDSARPPKSVSVKIDRDAYVVLLLVAPGHSATLLYPRDSVTDNHLTAGVHALAFEIPGPLVRSDTAAAQRNRRQRERFDSVTRSRARDRTTGNTLPPLVVTTPTYFLVVTSPQRLSYSRVREKTAGVSIPLVETEALNAVGKAVKSTLPQEPREWAGFYQLVPLARTK